MNVKKKYAVLPIATVMLSVFGVSQAEAQLCATKTGQVFSRAQCKPKETVVPGTPGPIGPAGPQGQAGPQGPAGESGVNTSPCTIASIAGVYSFESVGSTPFYAEGCTFVIQPDGTYGGTSFCSGARLSGLFGPISVSGKVNLESGPTCSYRFEYSYSNGESWIYRVRLNSTRNNILGSTFSNAGLAGTVVGTRWYPTASATASSAVESAGFSNEASEAIDAMIKQQQQMMTDMMNSMSSPE